MKWDGLINFCLKENHKTEGKFKNEVVEIYNKQDGGIHCVDLIEFDGKVRLVFNSEKGENPNG